MSVHKEAQVYDTKTSNLFDSVHPLSLFSLSIIFIDNKWAFHLDSLAFQSLPGSVAIFNPHPVSLSHFSVEETENQSIEESLTRVPDTLDERQRE